MDNKRRDFLKKATLATAGLSLANGVNAMSASSYNNIIGSNDRINVAIQGLGRRYGAFLKDYDYKVFLNRCAHLVL